MLTFLILGDILIARSKQHVVHSSFLGSCLLLSFYHPDRVLIQGVHDPISDILTSQSVAFYYQWVFHNISDSFSLSRIDIFIQSSHARCFLMRKADNLVSVFPIVFCIQIGRMESGRGIIIMLVISPHIEPSRH